MVSRSLIGAVAVMVALIAANGGARAFDDAKYPDLHGQWLRARPPAGVTGQAPFDPDKSWGLAQQAPLTPEYQKVLEASVADQEAGGQGNDTRVTCVSNGMPRLMSIVRPMEFFVYPWITLVVYENNIPRRIYTDGRDFPKDEDPTFAGYSIGTWIDTDKDGRYDELQIETRNLRGPRTYDSTGIPFHEDGETVIKERIYADKANPNLLYDEITSYDHALTRPWTVTKKYVRNPDPKPLWRETVCAEANPHVEIAKQGYMISADGLLMPTRKDQPPPDLRYFKQPHK